VPIEPIGSVVPALSPATTALDVVDSEDTEQAYDITENALQDFSSASTNAHRALRRITISGTLVSSLDGGMGLRPQSPTFRADLRRLAVLEAMAEAREPVMFISPRVSMARCFIGSIARSWNPELGDNSLVTISLVEARIVSPLVALAIAPDVAASATGNNAATQAGTQTTTPVAAPGASSPGFGVAPQGLPV